MGEMGFNSKIIRPLCQVQFQSDCI